MAGAFAAVQGVQFFKGVIADAEESRKVTAQTGAVIKSTGAAAGVSAGQVGDLAEALSRKNAVDDEAIQSGSNLLLTFTNIRNEAGRGNDIFNQANQTLIDMAAALGTDVSSGAIQLGKALNDPVKGISALTRVGVTFTEQQEEQIKAMAAAGDTAGAQRVILAELNKEFGGSAAAQATAGKRLQIVWGNIREELGARLLPIVDKVATFLADRLPGALDFLAGVARGIGAVLGPVFEGLRFAVSTFVAAFQFGAVGEDVGGFVDVVARFGAVTRRIFDSVRLGVSTFLNAFRFGAIGEDANNFTDVIARVGAVVRRVFDAVVGSVRMFFNSLRTGFTEDEGTPVERFALTLRNDVLPVITRVADVVRANLGAIAVFAGTIGTVVVAMKTWAAVTRVATAVQAAFNVVLALNPAAAVALAIAAVAAAVFVAYRRFEGFREVVDTVARAVVGAFSGALAFVREVWPQIAEAVDHAVVVIREVVTGVLTVVGAAWRLFGDDVLRIVSAAFSQVQAIITVVINTVAGVVRLVLAVINGDWGRAWDALKSVVAGAWEFIKATIGNALGALSGLIGAGLAAVGRAFSAAWNGMKDAAGGAVESIVGFVAGLPGRILGFAASVVEAFAGVGAAILDGIVSGIGRAVRFVGDFAKGLANALIDILNKQLVDRINDAIPDRIALGPITVNLPNTPLPRIPRLASGAVVDPTPGRGILANIGEGTRPEVIAPLPPGFLEAMERIAAGGDRSIRVEIDGTDRPADVAAEVVTALKMEMIVGSI